jgi:carboxyl-terminal processing protease
VRKHWITALAGAIMLLAATAGASHGVPSGQGQPACTAPSGPAAPVTPTTIGTIEQAYHCVFEHYYGRSTVDSRTLLVAAFAALTQELQRRGLDQPDATLPALTGNQVPDWAAFGTVYERLTTRLPDPEVRQRVAAAAIQAMTAALHDNHARWVRPVVPPDAKPGETYGLGITGLSGRQGSAPDPAATAPLFVTAVAPGSPAATQDVRPGDVIVSVNGAPPYAAGVLSPGVLRWINQEYPEHETVLLTLNRPATNRMWTVTATPAAYRAAPAVATATLLPGGLAHVTLPAFVPGAADQVLQAIAQLRKGVTLRGIILDLRGNRGGSPTEVNTLLGAFAHDKVTAYLCDANGECDASRTDDTVPLLDLPMVTLTDRVCGSACDHFSAAVKDHRLGLLVGTRTGGVVSGPASAYVLSDNSLLLLPSQHHLGPNREIIDGIGVAPDHHVPLTAYDLSTGRDPVLAKARTLLER